MSIVSKIETKQMRGVGDPSQCGHPWHKHRKLESLGGGRDNDNPNSKWRARRSDFVREKPSASREFDDESDVGRGKPDQHALFSEKVHFRSCVGIQDTRVTQWKKAKCFSWSSSAIDVNVTEKQQGQRGGEKGR